MLLRDIPDGMTREARLRALGALLDAAGARGVLIDERTDGLLVRARVSADGRDGRSQPLERRFADAEALGVELQRRALRSSGHRSGPLERDLRVLGHHLEREGWTAVSLIQDGDAWVVRRNGGAPAAREVQRFDRPRLLELESQAMASRRPEAAAVGA